MERTDHTGDTSSFNSAKRLFLFIHRPKEFPKEQSAPCDRGMSIQQLSPGDKLSLKGKLFELQKKLTIIDMENKQQPVGAHP